MAGTLLGDAALPPRKSWSDDHIVEYIYSGQSTFYGMVSWNDQSVLVRHLGAILFDLNIIAYPDRQLQPKP